MNSASRSFLHNSRLVQRLSELDVADIQVSQAHFSERFGQMFDLSGTVILSEMLEDLSAVAFNPAKVTIEAITDEFLKGRTALVHFIARRFVPGAAHGRGTLPTAAEFHAHCLFTDVFASADQAFSNNHGAAYEPYREFYVAHQGKLAGKIHHLRSQIVAAISGLSPELAQLASLEKGMGQALSVQTRQIYDVVPKLLGERFGKLLDGHWQELPSKPSVSDVARWMTGDGCLAVFCREMQEMLLSELEIRLQPILGLIDALFEADLCGRSSNELYEGKNPNCG